MKLSRRHFLYLTTATASLTVLNPPTARAASATDPRFVFIFLHGGMDGLGAVPTPRDENYQALRPTLAMDENETLALDDTFALHPALTTLHRLFNSGQMMIFHGVASPYRERSHFDATRQLEQGSDTMDSVMDGWLGRVSTRLYPDDNAASIALSSSVPLSLLGGDNVVNWAPSKLPAAPTAFLSALETLYPEGSPLSQALQAGRAADDIATANENDGGAANTADTMMMNGPAFSAGSPSGLATSAGQFLRQSDGPRIAVLDISSYDTHQNQAKTLNSKLADLDDSIAALEASLGNAWQYTSVFAVSEFGRTVAENGTKGTDHGTGGVAFLAGGAVSGGTVKADWRGLASDALYENRDLVPAFDVRSVLKAILIDHMGMRNTQVNNDIFPDSSAAPKMDGLFYT